MGRAGGAVCSADLVHLPQAPAGGRRRRRRWPERLAVPDGPSGQVRDPAALAGWLATTTRRECLRVLRAAGGPHTAWYVLDAENIPDERNGTAEQELLEAERHAALREAFMDLPPSGQQLIAMLIQDPPVPYAEISARLGIPVGSIGPIRGRCLDKLRRHPAIAALINSEAGTAQREMHSLAVAR